MPGVTHHTFTKGAWHDIVRPDLNDLQILVQRYGLDKNITEALLLPTARPHCERLGEALFIALHFPAYKPELKRVVPSEIDFAVTKKVLITVHYEPLPFLDEFTGSVKYAADLKPFKNPLQLLGRLLQQLKAFEFRQLDHIEDDIRSLENKKFPDSGADVVAGIAAARRNIIHFRRILKPQQLVFKLLIDQAAAAFGASEGIGSVYDDFQRVWQQLETHHEALAALQDTHYTFLSMHTNRSIHFLTLITAFFVIPLTALLVAFGIFAMYPDLSLLTRWAIVVEIVLLTFIAFVIMRQRHII